MHCRSHKAEQTTAHTTLKVALQQHSGEKHSITTLLTSTDTYIRYATNDIPAGASRAGLQRCGVQACHCQGAASPPLPLLLPGSPTQLVHQPLLLQLRPLLPLLLCGLHALCFLLLLLHVLHFCLQEAWQQQRAAGWGAAQ
jgi:hypothetical protein